MDIKSYQSHAEDFVKHYLLADPFLPYTSVLAGIFLSKMVIMLLFSCNCKLHYFHSVLSSLAYAIFDNRPMTSPNHSAQFISNHTWLSQK